MWDLKYKPLENCPHCGGLHIGQRFDDCPYVKLISDDTATEEQRVNAAAWLRAHKANSRSANTAASLQPTDEAKPDLEQTAETTCPTCEDIRTEHSGFGPSHNGSKMCESGSIASGGQIAHCSCDTCF